MAETPPGWGTRIISERAFAAAGLERTPAFEINDISTILDLVRNDLAVTLLPAAFVVAGDPSLVAVPVRSGATDLRDRARPARPPAAWARRRRRSAS